MPAWRSDRPWRCWSRRKSSRWWSRRPSGGRRWAVTIHQLATHVRPVLSQIVEVIEWKYEKRNRFISWSPRKSIRSCRAQGTRKYHLTIIFPSLLSVSCIGRFSAPAFRQLSEASAMMVCEFSFIHAGLMIHGSLWRQHRPTILIID